MKQCPGSKGWILHNTECASQKETLIKQEWMSGVSLNRENYLKEFYRVHALSILWSWPTQISRNHSPCMLMSERRAWGPASGERTPGDCLWIRNSDTCREELPFTVWETGLASSEVGSEIPSSLHLHLQSVLIIIPWHRGWCQPS